jgi:hypothetical protein
MGTHLFSETSQFGVSSPKKIDLSLPLALESDGAILVWWPNFKLNVSREAARLNKIARITTLYSSDQLSATQVSAANIWEACGRGNATLSEAVEVESAVAIAARAAALPHAHSSRLTWLKTGERPLPTTTKMVRSLTPSNLITTLSNRDGIVSSSPLQMATNMLDYLADISSTATVGDPHA